MSLGRRILVPFQLDPSGFEATFSAELERVVERTRSEQVGTALVLHPGALGDLILSLPTLALLRARDPAVEITVAGNTDFLSVVAGGYADRIVSLATLPLHRLYGTDSIPEEEARFWCSFDRIVSWTGAGDPAFERNLSSVHRGALVASWKPRPDDPRHVSRIFAESIGLELPERPSVEIRAGIEPRGATACLHPGAGSPAKRWPPERFAILARALAGEGLEVVVIEGPAEPGVAREVAAQAPSARAVAGLPLRETAKLVASARVFVGNDSGIAHLAAGLATPAVVLFGPTDPSNWAPLGPRVATLRDASGALRAIEPGTVLAAVAALSPSAFRR